MPGLRSGLIVLAVTALVMAGCGGAGDSAEPGPDPAPEPPQAAEPAPGGSPEPMDDAGGTVPESLDFQAPTLDGGELDAATLAGQPVLFWFWAAWCPRCAAAASTVRQAHAEYGDRVHVVGVAGLASGETGMRDFVDRHELAGFPHLADDEGQVWQRFGVTTQEFYVILDDSGTIIHEGPMRGDDLRDQLRSLAG